MKIKSLLILFILFCNSIFGQSMLFQEADVRELSMNDKEKSIYEKFRSANNVTDFSIIRIDATQLETSRQLSLTYRNFSTVVDLLEVEKRDHSNFTWFGTLDDGTGIFCTVLGNKVFSKFYLGNTPYSIVPLSNGYHMLLGFDNSVMDLKCGHEVGLNDDNIHENIPKHGHQKKKYDESKSVMMDDNCNLRVLIAFTDDADTAMDMQVIGQGMVDETNLAYMMSGIAFRMELAKTVMVNYNQLNTSTTTTIYGAAINGVQDDLINIRNGTNGFEDIPALRNNYQADVVVLVREGGLGGSNTFWGQAYGIPTGNQNPTPNNAFALVGNTTSTTLIAGRFSFAHEVAHIQGARHDVHNANPTYARGRVFSTTNALDRTIMCVGGGTCINTNTGCRVNFFSNPDITTPGGDTVGAADRDNARRLNETSVVMRNHRMTDDDLIVSNEVFEDESISNHLANETIITNGNVDAQNGSRVTMRAGNAVTLMPGFEATTGSVLTAYIVPSPCTVAPMNLTQDEQESPDEVSMRTVQNEVETIDVQSITSKNFPNPFTGQTTIEFDLPKDAQVTLFVSDIHGKQITRILDNEFVLKGTHQVIFDGRDYPAGMYYYTIQAGQYITTQKMTLIN